VKDRLVGDRVLSPSETLASAFKCLDKHSSQVFPTVNASRGQLIQPALAEPSSIKGR
jgi:hypothetical protein